MHMSEAEAKEIDKWSSVDLAKLGSLVYPIMLAQNAGSISESKASELLAMTIERYREEKMKAIVAIESLVESLPSPLILLLEGMKDKQPSSTKKER